MRAESLPDHTQMSNWEDQTGRIHARWPKINQSNENKE